MREFMSAVFPGFYEKKTTIATWQFSINRSSSHKDAAKAFIRYITGDDAKRVEYKMIVERANIPYNESFDDRAYSLLNPPNTWTDTDKAVRFKLIKRVENNELSYKKLCEHGYVGKNGRPLPMTSNRRLSDETSSYIEKYFKS